MLRYGPGETLPDRDPTPPDARCCECHAALPNEGGGGRDGDLCEDCVPRCAECSEPMLSSYWRECDRCADEEVNER